MNKSQLFKAAHKLAKSVIQKGDSYRVTFGLAIKAILSQAKKSFAEICNTKLFGTCFMDFCAQIAKWA